MIKIKINEDERLFDEIDEQWIPQQINRRRANGEVVCVRVTIQQGNLCLVLATPTCQGSGGGGGQFNQQERSVIDLWMKLGLSSYEFSGGNLNAFLKQLRKLM